jgi:hypothetical protein
MEKKNNDLEKYKKDIEKDLKEILKCDLIEFEFYSFEDEILVFRFFLNDIDFKNGMVLELFKYFENFVYKYEILGDLFKNNFIYDFENEKVFFRCRLEIVY